MAKRKLIKNAIYIKWSKCEKCENVQIMKMQKSQKVENEKVSFTIKTRKRDSL